MALVLDLQKNGTKEGWLQTLLQDSISARMTQEAWACLDMT
jgi:hypothetical protein